MVKMDSKIFDIDWYHKRNMFLSKDIISFNERPMTMVIDGENRHERQSSLDDVTEDIIKR